ncbi:hypothetical protein DY000_02045635 [Brassica cretica]|uniref:Uncharacterized protein n=1 Tax=Brassica cretica TaxID=69181 RepID=A0ABQ7ES06_BRACR|nr:hypothetical protein DY000_02045635 [Brassica cretica]
MSAMKRYLSVALVLLLIAFFSSKYSVEGRSLSRMTNSSQAMRDFQTRKDMKEAKPLVALQVWVYTALPELGATFGNPLPNNPSPPILAYKGRKGRRQFKEAILSQVFTSIWTTSQKTYN